VRWFGRKRALRPVEALPRLRKPLLKRVKPGLRPSRALPAAWVSSLSQAAKKAPPLPLAALPQPGGVSVSVSVFAETVRQARRGPVRRKVPVELAAAERGRVRQWPALAVNLVLLVVAADLAGSIYLREAMGVKLLDQYRVNLVPPSQSIVTDQAGRRVGTFAAADAMREPIEVIPTVFRDALIRWEDTRFYAHDGVDRYRMLGAVNALLKGAPQGGSTISMQLAKLIKKDSARTLRRKLEDIALALALDNRLGKEEELKYYANQAYFGSGVYGLGQACRYYFEREKCEGLTLEEASYLVSLLRAPADLSRDPKRAEARRNLVIEQMREPEPPLGGNKFERFSRALYMDVHRIVDHEIVGRSTLAGSYSHETIDVAKKQPLDLDRHRDPSTHPFVLESARQELQKRLGPSIYEDGLSIRLTIDSNIQASAEKALKLGLDNLREIRRKSGHEMAPDLDGGVVVIDPRTGHLLAYVPGADFKTSQVPFAARPIQVGSSMKPFVYGELFEQGKGNLDTLIEDGKICFGGWCPHNYDNKYHGVVTVQFALAHSLNTVAVRIADKVGVDAIAARLRLLGVQSQLTANLPMALGASELTLLELGGIYSALYDGRAQHPKLVMEVRNRDGQVLYSGDEPLRPRVYSPSTIQMLHVAMGGIMLPGGTAAVVGRELEQYFGLPPGKHLGEVPGVAPMFACKTGTHDGFTRVGLGCVISDTDYGPVVMVAYVGDRTPKGLGEGLTGGRVAGPIISALVKAITVRTRAAGFFRTFDDLPNGLPAPSRPRKAEPGEEEPELGQLAAKSVLTERQKLEVADALRVRAEKDPGRSMFSLARASLAGPDQTAPEQATLAVQKRGPAGPPRAVSPESPLPATAAAANEPRLSAPRDWSGLRVLDTDVVEASGAEIIKSFLDSGGREEELTELGPLLDMSVERHVIHEHHLLQPGFTDRPLSEKLMQLGDKVFASLKRMLSTQQVVTRYEHPDANTHVLSEADADRRIERVFRFANPPLMFRVTRHHTSGSLLALEWEDSDGTRHAMARRGEHMAPLATREVLVGAGSLEPAWLDAGMSPAQLDGLRALIGASISIDRIPRGFKLELLLADGGLIGVEAEKPDAHNGPPQRVSAIRTESACLAQDGIPCGRRFMPLALAEARFYGKRAAGDSGEVLIQRDQPGSFVSLPSSGHVIVADADRDQVIFHTDDGHVLQFDGVRPGVELGDALPVGSSIGRLDPRGVLVYRATETLADGRPALMEATDSLPELGGSDDSLRAVSAWWRELHAWLRGEKPSLRHPVNTHRT
jgi:penicillin-binding protein 1A